MTNEYDYKPRFGFDIRIKPNTEEAKAEEIPSCEWEGCARPGSCRARIAPDKPGSFWQLCPEHARVHNQSWDFFKGMDEDEVKAYCESIATGHRPTWKMGVNGKAQGSRAAEKVREQFRPGETRARMAGAKGVGSSSTDPYDLFHAKADNARVGAADGEGVGPQKHLTRLQRGALEDLNLDETAGMDDVRARYKELVKRFHPDANGGDRGAEDSLQRVIRAYQILKTSGFR